MGDRFRENDNEWEVVGFPGGQSYSASNLGGTPDVRCKPINGLSGWWKRWEENDGTVVWCGDSVAAAMLESRDGNGRSARGDILTK